MLFKGVGLVIPQKNYLSIYKSLKWHQGYYRWTLYNELYD